MNAERVDYKLYSNALNEARIGLIEGGIPIGAALARGSELLGVGHNRRIQNYDPTAHAEIECLRNAGRIKSYKDITLYTTLSPCYLCSGAIVLFKIKKVVMGQTQTYDSKGSLKFLRDHDIELVDLNDDCSINLMKEFILRNPKIWLEDIGEG